ncbi:MAG: ATP-binding protein [Hydrogenophilus sp.]|nr:ATP-binding protein [Hydrogenophilus sp.]
MAMNTLSLTLLITASIFVIFFAAASSLDVVLFGQAFPFLLAMAAVAIAALLTLALKQVIHLWRQVRRQKFGARLRLRLLGQLMAMAVVPAAVLYGVSLFFVARAIDSWFDVRVERALDAAEQLARHAVDAQVARLWAEGEWLLQEWPISGTNGDAGTLERFRRQLRLDGMAIVASNGSLVAFASDDVSWMQRELGTNTEWQLARKERISHRIVEEGDEAWVRAVLWLPKSVDEEGRFLILLRRIPKSVTQATDEVVKARGDYALIASGREALQRLYLVMLTVAVLTALVGATMVALHLTRRFIAPLMVLAEGTRQIAGGELRPLASTETFPSDELGVLVRSFDQMVAELQRARTEQEQSHAEVAAAKQFLESVLAHLSTGVLVFDGTMRLKRANEAAVRLLGEEVSQALDLPFADWPPPLQRFAQRVAELMQVASGTSTFEWTVEGTGQTLVVHVAPMSGVAGWVVVVDDISDVVLAQRLTAWGEIARRLAHEIKNPLTPIQLAAERLHQKLAGMLPERERQLLERATATIVAQVQTMSEMVNAFREYARLPTARRERIDLAELVASVLVLYEGMSGVRVRSERVGEGPWWVDGDAAQLRQVLHNLLQNALDALAGIADPEVVVRLERQGEAIVLIVQDNGVGFPEGFQQRAFEPYYTTKSKGTGLGLAVVKKIVDDHYARIVLQQGPGGVGAVVSVTFRAAGENDGEGVDRR